MAEAGGPVATSREEEALPLAKDPAVQNAPWKRGIAWGRPAVVTSEDQTSPR